VAREISSGNAAGSSGRLETEGRKRVRNRNAAFLFGKFKGDGNQFLGPNRLPDPCPLGPKKMPGTENGCLRPVGPRSIPDILSACSCWRHFNNRPLSVHHASRGQDIGGDLVDDLHGGLGQRVVVHRAGHDASGGGGVQKQAQGQIDGGDQARRVLAGTSDFVLAGIVEGSAGSDLLIIYLPISKGHFKGTQRGRLFTRRMTRRFRKRGRVGKKGLRRLTTARPRLARAAHQRRQAEGDLPLPRGGVVSDRT